eukprot:TRINITY_DN11328_c0_g1_i1.p1 TRINITY_DN11328_c0_g1~~TRINITY_DN11328_c0_g1_i1.p1  ORF type:complete len:517 (+),score=89.30 TRINITY_DN11328_c0_g1_i1:117-1667(+)
MSKAVACFIQAFVVAASCDVHQDCGAFFEAPSLTLLQVSANVSTRNSSSSDTRKRSTCSELANHGQFFTLTVEVGTPPQTFDVVADTGSDAVIIPSCLCQDVGACTSDSRCFRGSQFSSTFSAVSPDHVVNMEFASGLIKASVSTDVVRVGSVHAKMSQGLLLMLTRHMDITGPFEGILGLGQMQAEYSPSFGKINTDVASWDRPATSSGSREDADVGGIYGFLRQAHVDRFSICFNDGTSPGILRLNTERPARALPSVGMLHWGLNLRGMSVGAASSPVVFCGEDEGLECGVIPDSGSTIVLGPEDQLTKVFSAICDEWPRCVEAAETEFIGQGKERVFQRVLRRCEDWFHEGSGLGELPSIHIHLGNPGEPNASQTIELTGWSYVFEMSPDEADEHAKLLGNIGVPLTRDLRLQEKDVCAPAFGAFSTPGANPVWIVGAPLFYEYVVGFDRGTSPPKVSFSAELCGSCTERSNRQLSLAMEVDGVKRRRAEVMRTPRRLRGPLRISRFLANSTM